MGTGFRGTFVISWSQTEIDGLEAAPMQSLNVGAAWSWYGDPVRVDGPSNILRLDGADGSENLRKRAARMVHRLVGAALEYTPADKVKWDEDAPLMDSSFVVTDGSQTFTVTVIDAGAGAQPLLMFHDAMPPRGCELWVVHHTLGFSRGHAQGPDAAGVICFTKGTRVRTPDGARLIEDLREGDLVQTKDSGAQPVEWVGHRPMTGARLFAMPHMRPVRIRPGALGVERPDDALLVSPEHRMLISGDVARSLFNADEVLVAAKDLINGRTITVDLHVPTVTYYHVMLPCHEILWANGVETESFHPASTELSTLRDEDRARLLARYQDLELDPHVYGRFARRNLSGSEAAILRHAA